jgi:hypothetical protein
MGMTPSLVSFVFGGAPYDRLARVLRSTAARNCAGWTIRIEPIAPAPLTSALGIASHVHNTQKMAAWCSTVEAATDGASLLLIDADTIITRPLDDLWTQPFDFAYTTKPSRFPFNSGVVAVRVSAAIRTFFRRWRDENHAMLADRVHHQAWRQKYGGINQAALGRALESGWARDLRVCELPCREWNCEDSAWRDFDPALTRIVHVKSALRAAVLGHGPVLASFKPLVQLWRQLERQS